MVPVVADPSVVPVVEPVVVVPAVVAPVAPPALVLEVVVPASVMSSSGAVVCMSPEVYSGGVSPLLPSAQEVNARVVPRSSAAAIGIIRFFILLVVSGCAQVKVPALRCLVSAAGK